MNQTTRVTFEFPNGNKETFEVVNFVGAMTLAQNARGARMGAFATGDFSPATITGVASAVVEAVAKEMMNQGMPPQAITDVLSQIIPHAVSSSAVREVDAHMEALEKSDDPAARALAELLKLVL